VKIKPREPNFFEGTAVRKAILLTHHTNLLKSTVSEKSITQERFEMLNKFKAHFEKEMDLLEDDDLRKELKTLQTFIDQFQQKLQPNQSSFLPIKNKNEK